VTIRAPVAPKPTEPCAIVILGADGDLTRRLAAPALDNVATGDLVRQSVAMIGADRAHCTTDSWRQGLSEQMQECTKGGGEFQTDAIDMDVWGALTRGMTYRQTGRRFCYATGGSLTITEPPAYHLSRPLASRRLDRRQLREHFSMRQHEAHPDCRRAMIRPLTRSAGWSP
jgi:hypothetical protein